MIEFREQQQQDATHRHDDSRTRPSVVHSRGRRLHAGPQGRSATPSVIVCVAVLNHLTVEAVPFCL